MLNNKVMLVTGGASGIGRAVALVAARQGAHIVLSDIDTRAGNETLKQLHALGAKALFFPSDVAQPGAAQALVDHAIAHFGRLDIACNNAGIGGANARLADYPIDSWTQVINVNLSGVFYGMRAQIPAMLNNGGGAIVNVASLMGAVGLGKASAYTAAKHGVVGLTQAAALEYGSLGVRVNVVAPGFVQAPMISALQTDAVLPRKQIDSPPIGCPGLPEEVAELVVWLTSTRESFASGAYYPVADSYFAS